MPQLDSLTYFTQFFWFIICFIGLYIFIESIVLPHISIIFKTRNSMKLKKSELTEKKNIIEILSLSNLNTIENFSNNINLNSKNWYQSGLENIKEEQLNSVNTMYIEQVGIILLNKKCGQIQ